MREDDMPQTAHGKYIKEIKNSPPNEFHFTQAWIRHALMQLHVIFIIYVQVACSNQSQMKPKNEYM